MRTQFPLSPTAPLVTFWVSTPCWAVAVTSQGDRIVAIAPRLRRVWLGQSWRCFCGWVRRTYPGAWQAEQLGATPL
jgi:hypothetical protein